MVGMERFIALDSLHHKIMGLPLNWIGLTTLQALRDEVAAERQKYLDDPNYAKAEEAAYGR